uniref:Uncharacterized protein n=1 Tax=Utricularia reniformis TaxID=192314 RepID=A0A1Y0B016_9LAMI|nr:hypothetical protein AEK19_MT0458 [Utricularia reniformis]ART30718.1 hypothetical protein AEK19_MT0458 [Utricularia reniformis]
MLENAKLLNISVVSSKDKLADILNKPLASRFQLLRSSLTVTPVQYSISA